MSEVEEIKSKLNIVDVISDYIPLKKAGVNFKARCPFHEEKTPSFYVNPARQIWHCFGCGLGGDVFEFVKNIESVDFPVALERLAERAGVRLSRAAFQSSEQDRDKKKIFYELNELAARYYHKVLLESKLSEPARQYLQKRNFKSETITEWQIGYAPDKWDALYEFLKKRGYSDPDIEKAGLAVVRDSGGYFDRFRDRITFPILDLSGRTVGFSARILAPRENTGKYINSPESPVYSKSKVLFGLYQARNEIRKQNSAVVVEGNIDVIKSHQAGVKNVVGSSGTALTAEQLALLARFCETLVFAFDVDEAGDTAARRALEAAVAQGFNVRMISLPPQVKDPDEAIDQSPQIWQEAVKKSVLFLDFYFSKLFDKIDLNDIVKKNSAINEFLSLLALIPNKITIEHFIRKLSDRTVTSVNALVGEFRKIQADKNVASKGQKPQAKSSGKVSSSPSLVVEQRFIGLILTYPDFVGEIAESLPVDYFFHEDYGKIYKHLLDNPSEKRDQLTRSLQKYEPLVSVARFSVSEGFQPEKPEEELATLARRLKAGYFERERQKLAHAIADAEKQLSYEKRTQLAQKYNQLVQKMRELSE